MHRHGTLTNVSLGTRIIAFLWDYAIISGYLLLLVGLSFVMRPALLPLFTTSPLLSELTGFLFITLPVYLYFSLCEGSKAQATWGKYKMGIIVADMNGNAAGLGTSLLRSALKFLPWELAHFTIWHMVIPADYPAVLLNSLLAAVYGLALIYLISALFSRNKQTVYDLMAGTVVRYKE